MSPRDSRTVDGKRKRSKKSGMRHASWMEKFKGRNLNAPFQITAT